jgi:hypothetical protein
MSTHRHVPEPDELIPSPKPSWAPAFLALGVTGVVCGVFAAGFMFPPYIYMLVGAILVLGAVRGLARGAVRDFYRLPRRQRVRSAALPIEPISLDD